jgi:hypothetical protein
VHNLDLFELKRIRGGLSYLSCTTYNSDIDLRIETVLENNAEILRMMELLKAMPGIKDVVRTEIVEVVGRKMSIPSQIVDRL